MIEPYTEWFRAIDGLRRAPPAPRTWTLAQAVVHCAQSVEYSLTGYPKLRSWLFRATIGPIAKRRFLRAGAMKHDVLATIAGAPSIAADTDLGQACDRAAAAMLAFQAHTGPLSPHLAYGPCTKNDYAELHLLHLNDHVQSFALTI